MTLDELADVLAIAERVTLDRDEWLVLADALEEYGARRLGRNVRTLVHAFRRLMAFESLPRASSLVPSPAHVRSYYRRFWTLQRDTIERLYLLAGEAVLIRHASSTALDLLARQGRRRGPDDELAEARRRRS